MQNKIGNYKRHVHTHNDLKWSSHHQSGLEIPTLAPDWPDHIHRGPMGPKFLLTGLSVVVWSSQGQFGHLKATLVLQVKLQVIINMNFSILELHFVLQISQLS